MKKRILSLMIIASFTIGVVAQQVGEPAPDFSFDDYEGNNFTLSDHEGKLVFIFLFGNSCPSCIGFGNKTETEVNDVYGDREDFVAVGLDMWNSSSTSTSVEQFANQTGIEYPLLVKAGDVAVDYSTTYDRLMVVDKQGILRHKGSTLASNDLDNAIAVIEEYIDAGVTSVDAGELVSLRAFPVPANDFLQISFVLEDEKTVTLEIFNSLGRKMDVFYEDHLPGGNNEISLSVSDLAEGLYYFRLSTGKAKYSGKVTVKR